MLSSFLEKMTQAESCRIIKTLSDVNWEKSFGQKKLVGTKVQGKENPGCIEKTMGSNKGSHVI